ncbi:MAG: hypothetical protein KGH59_01035 [Candidatus Micrarchaeota archaeon]|nr:hypothetical protein [Candidatus Micrarchaeota archaeon]MDE1804353.1 hypothetical protein [Candidatus Micrarchaeota archaeon]MDE1846542.1 hypothetical protein [Candidatus Micrarchaeota archaeon]
MPDIETTLTLNQDQVKPFTSREIEVNLEVKTSAAEPYWVEGVFDLQSPISLAPDKSLPSGKTVLGILDKDNPRSKRIKLYTNSDTYPSRYKMKVTIYAYDRDGAISERREYVKEIEVSESNAQILQGP